MIMTEHPVDVWIAQRMSNLSILWENEPFKPKYLIADNSTRFSKHLTALLKTLAVRCIGASIRNRSIQPSLFHW